MMVKSTRNMGTTESISTPYIGERGPGVGVPGEVLEINHVAAAFPGRRQGRDAERVDGHGRVEPEARDVAGDESLHRPPRQAPGSEAVLAPSAGRPRRAEECP